MPAPLPAKNIILLNGSAGRQRVGQAWPGPTTGAGRIHNYLLAVVAAAVVAVSATEG